MSIPDYFCIKRNESLKVYIREVVLKNKLAVTNTMLNFFLNQVVAIARKIFYNEKNQKKVYNERIAEADYDNSVRNAVRFIINKHNIPVDKQLLDSMITEVLEKTKGKQIKAIPDSR